MSKKAILMGLTLSLPLILGACDVVDNTMEKADAFAQDKLSSIVLPFDWFKTEGGETIKTETHWKKIKGLELPNDDNSKSLIAESKKNVTALEEYLLDVENIEKYLSQDKNNPIKLQVLAHGVKHKNALDEVIQDIYSKPHQKIQSVTLNGIGQDVRVDEPVLRVSISAVNDTMEFDVYSLNLSFNENGYISFVEQRTPVQKQANTPTPITEDSELIEGVHKEFRFIFKDLIAFPKKEDWKSVNKDDFYNWLTTNGVEEKDDSAVAMLDWYVKNEGNLSLAKITSYTHFDEDATALTFYELSLPKPNSDEVDHITIAYDRGLNQVMSITTDVITKDKKERVDIDE